MNSTEDPLTLEQLTISAFCERSIRNAVLIDEQFPKLSDTLACIDISEGEDSIAEKYPEWEKAKGLYEAFHSENISCDVENDPSRLGELSEKIKKSDLVVLDLHLRDSSDATESIEVIKSLAVNNRFNLVVVYTKDEQLKKIAVDLAGSVRGARKFEDPDLETAFASVLDELADYDLPVEQMVIDYICGRETSGRDIGKLRGCLAKDYNILKQQQQTILSALAAHFLRDQYDALPSENLEIANAVNFDCPNPWMVFSNLFVVVANKSTTSPAALLAVVRNAILDWKPGIVRTIISQIQNTMADNGYAFAGSLANDLETQISLLWHAKNGPQQEPAAVKMLVQQMLLSLRASVSSDEELAQFVASCIATLPDLADPLVQLQELTKAVSGANVCESDVLHALNCFESTEDFSADYITTGTVLFSKDSTYGERWWVCVEPACDTIPEQASSQDNFLHCRLLELRKCTHEKDEIVHKATRSRYIFVKLGSSREFLDSLNETSAQPKPVTGFVKKHGQVIEDAGVSRVSVFFPDRSMDKIGFLEIEMQVVTQLQEPYANRLLQETGNQLSRIGLNFIDFPKPTDE